MASKAIPIDLGDMAERAAEHVRSGRFGSLDEVVRAGIEALDHDDEIDLEGWTREEFDAHCRKLVREALDDPRPPIPIDEAFAEIRRRAAARRG